MSAVWRVLEGQETNRKWRLQALQACLDSLPCHWRWTQRFFHKLSTSFCISGLVIFVLAASRGGGPMSLLPIHLCIHPMTHTVSQYFSSLLLLSAIWLSFSPKKEKSVLDWWEEGGQSQWNMSKYARVSARWVRAQFYRFSMGCSSPFLIFVYACIHIHIHVCTYSYMQPPLIIWL